jgi:hypothetical protein
MEIIPQRAWNWPRKKSFFIKITGKRGTGPVDNISSLKILSTGSNIKNPWGFLYLVSRAGPEPGWGIG